MNTLDPDQPSGVTIEATDEDGADNNVIEYSIYCDYGEGGSNFGFLIDAASGVLRVNTSMGETDRDYECIILVRASSLQGYSYDQLIGWVDLDLGSSPGWWPIL